MNHEQRSAFLNLVHDRMTECPYPGPLSTFEVGISPEPVCVIPLLEEGRTALERINREMGLGLDDWDLDYYTNLFVKDIGRNPTNVECFDLSQSNSEHSRHWFFRGRLIVDGKEVSGTLMRIVKATWEANQNNSVIAFSDNSSAISGYDITSIIPAAVGSPSAFREARPKYRRDAQLPVGCRALSRGRDRHGGQNPRRAGDGHGRPRGRGNGRLLRGKSAHTGIRTALGRRLIFISE
jgi:hypothetical protein